MNALFFFLNDNNHHDHHHFPITAASTSDGHASRADRPHLDDILNPYNNFTPYADDGRFAPVESYYSSYNYPPEVDYGGLVVDYWAPDPAANSKPYVPDQFRADIMSDRDDWSILEKRRRQRRLRLAAYRAWAQTVLKRIVGYDHIMTKAGGKQILPNEQRRQRLHWLDGSGDFDVLNDEKVHSLRRRRRQERQRRRRSHRRMNSNSSDDALNQGQSLEARAKAIGLAEPAYHKRWYRTPRYGAYNPHSLSARAIHQYASLVSPVLSSPRMPGSEPGHGGYHRSAAAKRRLIAIQQEVENETHKQELKEKRKSKKKDQKQMKEKGDCEDSRKKIRANKDGGVDDSDVHTSIDCTATKSSTKPCSTALGTRSSKVSVATNTIAATASGASSEDAEDPSTTLVAIGNNSEHSRTSSTTTATTPSRIVPHEISPILPVNRELQPDDRLTVVPSPGRRSFLIPHTNSASSRQSYRSYGTNRTYRSAPHRALHRGLRRTRRFLRFINSKLGKVIWHYYYHWVYPFWDIWQERKQKEQTHRREEESEFKTHETKGRENLSTQQNCFSGKWPWLRSLFTQWFCIWPWTQQHQLNEERNDDRPPNEKLDALEAQTDSAVVQNAAQRWERNPLQERESGEPLPATTSYPNVSETVSTDRELRIVDPIPIPSDIDSGSNDNSQDDEPLARKKNIAIKRKSNSRSSDGKNNTWTKGCVLCGLERLGAAVREEVNNLHEIEADAASQIP